ncbi:Class I SAM-dependent methyltransferase [Helicobacter suis]|uniref:Class I SAM-dependent methyltransferase n=1 Tax=Helicobacter suis TaxID=104628 RepID=A0ABM7KX80_9HELI|nr:SAM-dependent methyltransferase [Helicobacter suis]BCD45060.1 Class I SAM-dependent methyltransferase [Helicobacter suis]BCD50427.1 Class I SAM-dependent methyltransferase [Helicobacter suis]
MQSFSQCMQEWLYGENGYYRHALIGMQGDFYTAVNSSAFFGGTLAFYLLSLLENGRLSLPLSVVEIGAGEGLLLSDVVGFLKDLSQGVLEHIRFISVELLDRLVNLQKEKLAKRGVDLECVACLENLELSQSVFIYCNELWDSFPCEVIDNSKKLYISHSKPIWQNLSSEEMYQIKAFYPAIKSDCLPLSWGDYITSLCNQLRGKKWIMVSFDYGQYGSYGGISLRGYRKHQVLSFQEILDNLQGYYQKIDLTYDVDFKLLETLFLAQGAHTLFYGTQSTTLLKMGLASLLELFHASAPFTTYQRESIKARALINPEGFGERFKGLIVGN